MILNHAYLEKNNLNFQHYEFFLINNNAFNIKSLNENQNINNNNINNTNIKNNKPIKK